MSLQQNFQLMALYNQWMNKSLYEVSSILSHEKLMEDWHLFFGSVFGTLNHLLGGDTIWLKRFARQEKQFSSLIALHAVNNPASLDQILYADFSSLWQVRSQLDATIVELAEEASDEVYGKPTNYRNEQGINS